jgi:DivIVA domain-containing protein
LKKVIEVTVMALTPEDVVNKRFQPTKFREGYDQDEVDDFLDEVVVELRRLNQENEELRQRLIASDSRIAELQRSGAQAAPAVAPTFAAPEPAPVPEPAPAFEAAPQAAPEPVQVAEAAAPPAAVIPAPSTALAYPAPSVDSNAMDPSNTNNLLQLARRLHEEHVREGVEKRDALIAEGHATAAAVVAESHAAAATVMSEATETAARTIAEAEAEQRAQIGSLDQERQALETRIDELRTFEREYRQKLKSYIESQLHELDDATGDLAPAAAPASAFGGVPTPPPSSAVPSTFPGFATN